MSSLLCDVSPDDISELKGCPYTAAMSSGAELWRRRGCVCVARRASASPADEGAVMTAQGTMLSCYLKDRSAWVGCRLGAESLRSFASRPGCRPFKVSSVVVAAPVGNDDTSAVAPQQTGPTWRRWKSKLLQSFVSCSYERTVNVTHWYRDRC